MKKYRKTMQVAILLIIIMVGAFTIAGSLFSKTEIPTIGSAAPDFTLPLMDGGEMSLQAFKGKAVIINFWGTYCPPCVREMPLIQSYYDQYKDQGLVVLGVNENDPLVTAKAFVRQYKLTFPILMDKDTVRKQFGVTAYPSTFFIDRDGDIQAIKEGEVNEAYLRRIVDRILVSNGG